MGACVFIQKNLDLDAKVKELLASYYGEAAFSAVAADLLKPCGEDWLASQVLDGEGEGEASRIQWEAVESMLEHRRPPRPPAASASSDRVEPQPIVVDPEADEHDDNADEPHFRCRLEMLVRNHKNNWVHSQKRGPEWAFYVPRHPPPPDCDETVYKAGDLHVECFLCHAAKQGRLHSQFPAAPDEETQAHDDEVSFWAPPIPRTKDDTHAKHTIFYQSKNGNNSLRKHLRVYHSEEFKQVSNRLKPAAGSTASAAVTSGTTMKQDTDDTLKTHFRSTKRRKTSDPKVSLFWRMLAILVVFCCLPFSIVENPYFRAFIWFLDASMPLPSRRKLCEELLPDLAEKGRRRTKEALVGVRGVAITFDLWMSRKSEDNLSVDSHFIDRNWSWRHFHIGIVSCKDSSAGEDIAPRTEPALTEYALLNDDIKEMTDAMITRILEDVDDMLAPFYVFDKSRGHEVMATMLDPCLVGGVVFVDALAAKHGDRAAARSDAIMLIKQYKDDVLLEALLTMHRTMEEAKQAAGDAERAAGDGGTAGDEAEDALDLMRDGEPDEGALELMAEDNRKRMVEAEWSRYLTKASQLRKAGGFEKGKTMLDWWRMHHADFPLVAELARLLLCIPASQIECERIFSLAELVTQHLRNRMGVEMMSQQVFIKKNVDAATEVQDILMQAYGPQTYRTTLASSVNIPSELHEARKLAAALEDELPDSDISPTALDVDLADAEQQLNDMQTVCEDNQRYML
eukprot:jgi/Tetstr1/449719/TSEL_036787.t2